MKEMTGPVMQCPKCGEMARRVRDAKPQLDADGWQMVVRRRHCQCGHTFPTYECHEYADVEVVFRARKLLHLLEEGLREIDRLAQPVANTETADPGL